MVFVMQPLSELPARVQENGNQVERGAGESERSQQGRTTSLPVGLIVSVPTPASMIDPSAPWEARGRSLTCGYPHGSQLAEAVSFLSAHRRFVDLVTIDIGANDLGDCLVVLDFSDACRLSHQTQMASNLATLLHALRAAAGPDVSIVGMNYYDPFTGLWVLADQLFGGDEALAHQLARASVDFFVGLNDALEATYDAAGVAWADVESAFAVTDFRNHAELAGFGTVPLSTYNSCTLTLFCTGLDVHANDAGFAVIAGAFAREHLGGLDVDL